MAAVLEPEMTPGSGAVDGGNMFSNVELILKGKQRHSERELHDILSIARPVHDLGSNLAAHWRAVLVLEGHRLRNLRPESHRQIFLCVGLRWCWWWQSNDRCRPSPEGLGPHGCSVGSWCGAGIGCVKVVTTVWGGGACAAYLATQLQTAAQWCS